MYSENCVTPYLMRGRSTMKTVFDILRQPFVIGAFALSALIVAGAYFGSQWYYGSLVSDVLLEDEATQSQYVATSPPVAPAENSTPPPKIGTEVDSVDKMETSGSDIESEALDLATVASDVFDADSEQEDFQRVSPFGFGPYPSVPPDYPEDAIWEEDMEENISQFGSEAMKAAELIDRILIKLWNQGHRATSASMNSNGLVYPAFPNTVYVTWKYIEEDGTLTRYAGRISSGTGVSDNDLDDLGDGIIPSGIMVLDYDSDGIDPYTFLGINR